MRVSDIGGAGFVSCHVVDASVEPGMSSNIRKRIADS